jgi:uncharacterized protein YcbK (DUF882 family)
VNRWNYFQDSEVAGLDVELVAMLDRARGIAGIPFLITCGLRTQAQNDALPQSVKDSAHLTGHAVDISCTESNQRFKITSAFISAGFKRIGIYADGHIHVDNDTSKPQGVMWLVV